MALLRFLIFVTLTNFVFSCSPRSVEVVKDCGYCSSCVKGHTQHIFDGDIDESLIEKVKIGILRIFQI